MATLIIGPDDLDVIGKNLKDKSKLDLSNVDIVQCMNDHDVYGVDIEDVDVIIYREGKTNITIKAPNK